MSTSPISLNLFLFSALLVAWLTPISAWWTLHGERDRNAKIWFAGTGIYACAVTVFVFGPIEIIYPRHALVHFLTLASVLCAYEALQRESHRTDVPLKKYSAIIISEQLFFAMYEFFEVFDSYGVAFHHVILSVIEIMMIIECAKIHKNLKSKSILIVIIVLFFLISCNIGRVFFFLKTGIYPNLRDQEFISRYSLMVTYLSLIFFSYGYWGFVGEKYRFNLNKAVAASLEAEARELKTQGEKLLAERLLKERVAITDGLISLAQNIRGGAMASSIVHELTQPLAALKLEIDQLSDSSTRNTALAEFREQIEKIKCDLERLVNVAVKTREVFTLRDPTATSGAIDTILSACLEKTLAHMSVTDLIIEKEFLTPLSVTASFEELELAFCNLFDNALKALSLVPPGRRSLRLKTWREHDAGFISIIDTGEGIPSQIKDKMFEISVSNNKNSMGLGLWLSRYIIERNGGMLKYNELNTTATEFVIRLPVEKNKN